MTAGMSIPAVSMFAQPAAAAAEAVSLSQCTNGMLGSTSFSDWVNGNANGSKSHWKEGQFISYRADLTGLGAGSHTYTIHYHTVESSKHAIDYLGSYDATETTSPTAGPENRNDSNPCFDILGSGSGSGCTAPPPRFLRPTWELTRPATALPALAPRPRRSRGPSTSLPPAPLGRP
jgi:hypothetical protein